MRISILTMAFLCMSFATSLFAATPSFLKNNGSSSIILYVNEWKSEKIFVSIRDNEGIVVFSEKISPLAGNRRYELSALNAGQYMFVVEDGLKVSAQKFSVTPDGVKIDPSAQEKFKPVFITDENTWKIQGLALDQKVSVTIFDEQGSKLYNESIARPVVERSYNVSQLEKGEYYLEYNIGGDKFTYHAFKK